jgi:coenzyme F420 hydrogenase subunit beta
VDARPPFRQLRHQCGQSSQRPVDSLFRRFTVEVFIVRFRGGAGMVDNPVAMIRRCIERIELQWNAAGIDDVVIRPSRDDYGETRADHRVNAIENGDIDGAVVTKSNGLKTTVSIARNRKEILSSSGSKYCPVDCSKAVQEVYNLPGKFAFVGLPCQIAALRKIEETNSAIKDKIVLHIGLFCGHNVSFAGTKLLLENMHIKSQDVEDLRYRARKGNVTGMLIKTKDGKERFIPSKKYWTRFFNYFFVPSHCLNCQDLTSELADISVGDAWLPVYKKSGMRHCVFITRNPESSKMIQLAMAKGFLNAKKVDGATVVKSQRLHLQIKKRQTYSPGLLATCNLAITKIGHFVSIQLKMYSALRVFLQVFRVSS